jgi:hypothetical protein
VRVQTLTLAELRQCRSKTSVRIVTSVTHGAEPGLVSL